jgi:hypothetical protein
MKEQLLMKFKLPMIESISMVNAIVFTGYQKTGNKFSVCYNGSKSYLSNVEICCEGYQEAENKIWIENLKNKNGTLMSKMVTIFHSEEKGVRVCISTNNLL